MAKGFQPASTGPIVVGIAASAGGLFALGEILAGLAADFPAAIIVAQHLSRHHPSKMAEILDRHSRLPVMEAREGDELRPGWVYIAPPDRHVLVNADATISITDTPRVHNVRPSADLLFQSIGEHFKGRGIVIVLTGTGTDGAAVLAAFKTAGGTVIAQSEATSEFTGMPGAAIRTGTVDFVIGLDDIAAALRSLVAARGAA